MPYRIGIRPSKPVSLVGMIVGLIFIGLGVAFVMPHVSLIGLAWTAIAGAITFYHAYNFFSTRGISTYEINVDQNPSDNIRRR